MAWPFSTASLVSPMCRDPRWNARRTQGGVPVPAAERKGDVYLTTPKGESLRSLKAAERWLGLAATSDTVAGRRRRLALVTYAALASPRAPCFPPHLTLLHSPFFLP